MPLHRHDPTGTSASATSSFFFRTAAVRLSSASALRSESGLPAITASARPIASASRGRWSGIRALGHGSFDELLVARELVPKAAQALASSLARRGVDAKVTSSLARGELRSRIDGIARRPSAWRGAEHGAGSGARERFALHRAPA